MTTGSKKYIGPYLGQPGANSGEVVLKLQSAAITPQPLLGVNTVEGLYRVSLMIVVTANGTSGTMTMACSCACEAGQLDYTLPAQTVTPSGSGVTSNAMKSGQFVVPANGTGDITWFVVFNGVSVGALKYTIRVVAERITTLTS